jgi:predicted permease
MLSDLKFALRQLAKSPGFTAVAILTLALGIGANTAIFSVINAALLRPLPYPEPRQLVQLWSTQPTVDPYPVITGPEFKHWRDHATLLDRIAISRVIGMNLTGDGPAQRIGAAEVSPGFLDVYRIKPFLGRNFTKEDGETGQNHRVVVLTYEWWKNAFGGDGSLVGRTIRLNDNPFTVIGVLPPRALVQRNVSFLIPLDIDELPWRTAPDSAWATAVARLKPGVSIAQAQAELESLNRDLYATLPKSARPLGVSVRPMQRELAAASRPALLLLLGAVALVLLIACANVANLLLARATTRQKEMALRAALGASNRRIMRQVLTESIVLAALSGGVGVLVAVFTMGALGRLLADRLPEMMQPALDGRVLAFSLVVACGTGLLFGIFPALRARRIDLNRDLRDGGRGSTSGSRAMSQSLLIVSEIALTMTLLIGTGLLLRSFTNVMDANPGFDPARSLAFDLSLSPGKFAGPDAVNQFEREAIRRLEALPGVEAAGLTTTVPLDDAWGGNVRLTERSNADDEIGVDVDFVDAGYFRAMGIPLLKGRVLTPEDEVPNAPKVAVINDRLAELLLPGEEPLGRRVHIDNADWEIVGVVASVRQRQLDAPPSPHVYRVHTLTPFNTCVVVRTVAQPEALMADIRRTMTELDPSQSVANLRTLDHAVSQSLQPRRLTLLLIGVFATIALGLACLGIYGVMAYTISQRQREFSIRLALGALNREVIALILKDGLRLGVIGIAAGAFGGFAVAQVMGTVLYEISGLDPVVFATVTALLVATGTISVFIPALRATRVDVLSALRAE